MPRLCAMRIGNKLAFARSLGPHLPNGLNAIGENHRCADDNSELREGDATSAGLGVPAVDVTAS